MNETTKPRSIRTRAWVFVDTDRDSGHEIDLVSTSPLKYAADYTTGEGGVQALVVDHQGNIVRIVGFWKDEWHELRWDESHPGKWALQVQTQIPIGNDK